MCLVQELKEKRKEILEKESIITYEVRSLKLELEKPIGDSAKISIQKQINAALRHRFRISQALTEINHQIRISNIRAEQQKSKKYQRYQSKIAAVTIND